MRSVVRDRVAWSVCRSITIVSPAKAAEPMQMRFGLWTRMGPGNYVLDGDVHWRNLANTTEPSVCCGDAASGLMSNNFDQLLSVL